MSTKIGLVGYASKSGIGYENLRMWNNLPFDRWLAVPDFKDQTGGPLYPLLSSARQGLVQRGVSSHDGLAAFTDGLDAVVAVERTFPSDLFLRCPHARRILLVNHEWTAFDLPWLDDADVLVARNLIGLSTLQDLGLWKKAIYCSAPLDLKDLPFRRRERAERFMYSDGRGGVHERKGWPEVCAVLHRDPAMVTVFSQRVHGLLSHEMFPPEGTDLRPEVAGPRNLYAEHDVAVQPSRFEGLGLSILEAMASGLPVLTTDAHPMCEYVRAAYGEHAGSFLVRVDHTETARLRRDVTSHVVETGDLQDKISDLVGRPIGKISQLGRDYIERVHGQAAWKRLWAIITGEIKP